jgi:hypothetical protein
VIVAPVKDKSLKSTIATPDATDVLGFGCTNAPPPDAYVPLLPTSLVVVKEVVAEFK